MLYSYGAAFLGLYMTYVVIQSLRTGAYRYRGRTHLKADEPKTYWMAVVWAAVLAVALLSFAVMEWFRTR